MYKASFALALAIGLGVGLTAAPASADDVGPVGVIAVLANYTTSADSYLAYHGRMIVAATDGTVQEYRWGGVACGTKVLSDAEVAALQAAQNNKKMLIRPSSLPVGGSTCLVGFELFEKKNLALLP